MAKDEFSGIGPYVGQEFEDATLRLRQYPQLIENFSDIISKHVTLVKKIKYNAKKKELVNILGQVHNCDEFKSKVTCEFFLKMVEESSIDKLTASGFEKEKVKPCVYIGNHRDIILDAGLLCYELNKNNLDMCDMVIGDNLLANQFVTDMFKCNGSITVHRNVSSVKDFKEETLRLSRFVRESVEERGKSVWIAQKSGRSKDGVDNTSPAILKMLYLSYKEDGLSFSQFLEKLPIVPVSISYQFDPCDVSKGHEEIRKLREEGCYNVYKKKKYADILDVVRGIRLYKGNVHLSLGTQIDAYEDIASAVREIDRQIHTMYHLWDTNYFAYDYVNNTQKYSDKYQELNTKSFLKRINNLSKDVAEFVLNEYANPVKSLEFESNN